MLSTCLLSIVHVSTKLGVLVDTLNAYSHYLKKVGINLTKIFFL